MNEYKITTKDAATYLGITEARLRNWRSAGDPFIPYQKLGGSVRYRKVDLDEWLASRVQAEGEK